MDILPIIILGLSGMDVLGLFVATYALSKNSKRKDVYIFSTTILLMSVLLGLLFSKVLSFSINYFTNILDSISGKLYAIISFILGLVLLYWFLIRLVNEEKIDKKEVKKEGFFVSFIKKDLFLVSILFSLWIVTDPTFWGIVTITSISNNYILDIISFVIWIILSELPLYVLVIFMLINKDQKLRKWYNEKFENNKNIKKIKKILNIILSIIIYLGSTYFLMQAMHYFIRGSWLF